MPDFEFELKTMPPRLPRAALARPRLLRDADRVLDRGAVALVAPAGFGKTTLLLQWRQCWLQQGVQVAWISAGAQDDPVRFAALLVHALQALGAIDAADVTGRAGLEAVTATLAAVARRGAQVVLVVDDGERLPTATVEQVLQYLLLNAPANLHLVLGARTALPLRTAELLAHGRFLQLSAGDLSLQAEESLALLQARLGTRLDLDACMRLHAATEGWPIGLQLASAAIEQEADPLAAARNLSARRGSLQDYFADSMRAAFPADTIAALSRIAILDRFNVELGELVCAGPVHGLLEQLLRETPILVAGEQAGWYRLHPLARDYLLALFERLPAAERAQLHARAAHWYRAQGQFHEAAAHALAAGDEALAHASAAQALWTLGAQGRLDEARELLARMPGVIGAAELQVRLAAATVLAFSERNEDGLRLALAALADPALPLEPRVVALRAATSAAAYADHPGLLQELLAGWPSLVGAVIDPLYRVNRCNVAGYLSLHAGETAQVQQFAMEVAGLGEQGSLLLARAINCMLVGMRHLWDGNPGLAQALLSGPLQQAERQQGRRSMIACLYASVLAQALCELDQPKAVQLLLADRLDMIERSGFPDNLIAAYGALVQAALARGDEAAASNALDGLEAVAARRRLPRLRLHALGQRVRLLALKGCHASVASLLPELDALAGDYARPALRLYQPECTLVAAMAHAHAALAADQLEDAGRWLDVAAAQAATLRRGRDVRAVQVLRAVLARRRGDPAANALLLEAIHLMALSGSARLLADTHPQALEMAQALGQAGASPAPAAAVELAPSTTSLLTAKELEILGLLEQGLSNKRIALQLGIGAETVKWHLKNLFSKLSAVSRQHAVDRARLLGLVA